MPSVPSASGPIVFPDHHTCDIRKLDEYRGRGLSSTIQNSAVQSHPRDASGRNAPLQRLFHSFLGANSNDLGVPRSNRHSLEANTTAMLFVVDQRRLMAWY